MACTGVQAPQTFWRKCQGGWTGQGTGPHNSAERRKGHHPTRNVLGAKRGKRRKSLHLRGKFPPVFSMNGAYSREDQSVSFLLDRARPVFFSPQAEKRKWGVHSPAIVMAEISPARQGRSNPVRRKAETPSISSDGTQDKCTSSTSARCRRGRDHSGRFW